jgi:hypothetical protein
VLPVLRPLFDTVLTTHRNLRVVRALLPSVQGAIQDTPKPREAPVQVKEEPGAAEQAGTSGGSGTEGGAAQAKAEPGGAEGQEGPKEPRSDRVVVGLSLAERDAMAFRQLLRGAG